MSRSRLIISIIVIIVLITAIVLAVLLILNQRQIDEDEIILPSQNQNLINSQPSQPNLPTASGSYDNQPTTQNFVNDKLTEQQKEQGFLIKTAKAFSERFGSYSNQSNYENLIDLKYFMTVKMQSWVDDQIMKGLTTDLPDIYYGITTRAVNADISSQTNVKAEVLVKTQREEFFGASQNSKLIYKDILIVFEREGGVWKVAGAFWQ